MPNARRFLGNKGFTALTWRGKTRGTGMKRADPFTKSFSFTFTKEKSPVPSLFVRITRVSGSDRRYSISNLPQSAKPKHPLLHPW